MIRGKICAGPWFGIYQVWQLNGTFREPRSEPRAVGQPADQQVLFAVGRLSDRIGLRGLFFLAGCQQHGRAVGSQSKKRRADRHLVLEPIHIDIADRPKLCSGRYRGRKGTPDLRNVVGKSHEAADDCVRQANCLAHAFGDPGLLVAADRDALLAHGRRLRVRSLGADASRARFDDDILHDQFDLQ